MVINYTKKGEMALLRKELREYEALIGPMTPEERRGLREWVADGCQPICNPWFMCCDSGIPMDYIVALRIIEDMLRNPENYYQTYEAALLINAEAEYIPF